MGFWSKVKKFLKKVAPVVAIVVAVVAPQLLPAIGEALGATGVAANAVGAAAVTGGTTAIAGGTPEEVLKSAAAAGLGTYAGGAASGAVKGAQQAGTLSGTVGGSSVLPAAAGGAAQAGTGTLVYTGDVGKAAQAAALGGVAAGGGELASSAAQKALPTDVGRTGQALTAGGAGGATEALIRGEDPLLGAALSAGQTAAQTKYLDAEAERLARQDQAIAAFSQPRSPGVGTQYGQPTASVELMERGGVPGIDISGVADDTLDVKTRPGMGAGVSGAGEFEYAGRPVGAEEIVVTGAREPISYVSPTGLARFTPSKVSERDRQMMEITGLTRAPKPTEDIAEPSTQTLGTDTTEALPGVGVTGEEEKLASQEFPLTEPSAADRRLINYLYGNMGAPMGAPYGGREMGAGTSALAQALSVGDPGALYLGKKGKERRPVWNVESLKLSDELGGTYG